jgi:uncharacterized protein (TIGR02597 family)
MVDGDAKGRWSTIASNNADEITLEDTSFMADIANGDTFKVIKHVTISQVFPDALLGISFRKSGLKTEIKFGQEVVSLDEESIGTQVFTFDDPSVNAPGIGPNKTPVNIYVYGDGAWRSTGAIGDSADDDILPPDKYLYIRNSTSGGKLTFIPTGTIELGSQAVKLIASGSTVNDTVVGAMPVTTKLKDLGLGGTSAFEDSILKTEIKFGQEVVSLDVPKDELLVFGPTGDTPADIYVYAEGHWRSTASIGDSADEEVIPAAGAMIIRKKAGSTTDIWVNSLP